VVDVRRTEAEQPPRDGSADQADDDQVGDKILLGPSDRGVLSVARAGRDRRPGAGVRGRKTGTAEVANAKPHAWFAAFAPADDPKVVVAVLVENAGTGAVSRPR